MAREENGKIVLHNEIAVKPLEIPWTITL